MHLNEKEAKCRRCNFTYVVLKDKVEKSVNLTIPIIAVRRWEKANIVKSGCKTLGELVMRVF